MTDPRQIAAGIVGAVEWETEVSGLCHCPGESLHTHKTGKKDCRVNIDGAPTIHCFHSSCAGEVAKANHKLRSELGRSEWSLVLPGGGVLRSGDVLKTGGSLTGTAGSAGSGAPMGGAVCQPEGKTYILRRETIREQALANGQGAANAVELETLRACAERFKADLFEKFRWPFANIVSDSPLLVAERAADEQFRTWLKLWPAPGEPVVIPSLLMRVPAARVDGLNVLPNDELMICQAASLGANASIAPGLVFSGARDALLRTVVTAHLDPFGVLWTCIVRRTYSS